MVQPTSLKKKHHLADSTWTYKGFHGVLHTFFPVGETGMAMRDFFGDAVSITLFFVQNDYVHWYWNDNDLTRIRDEFLRRLKKDKRYLEKLKEERDAKVEAFNAALRRIDKADLKKLSNEKIAELYDDFYRRYVDEFKYFMVLGDAVSMHADRYLTPEFQKVLGANFTADFPKLLSPHHLSFIEEEGIAREKLVQAFRKTDKLDRKTLERHASRFFYIHNNYAKGVRLTADDFARMIREDARKDVEPAKDRRKAFLAQKAKLVKKYKPSPWHKILLYVMDEFFEFQDTRKKYVLISNYYQFQFLKEAERRGGIPFEKLQYSIYPEFRDALAGNLDKGLLDRRRKGCACIHTNDSFEVLDGDIAQSALDFFQKKSGEAKEIKGMVASPGKAKGRVKKILKIHDMANMDEGDILVSSMTRPEMVPAMKLAAAIVTDEGGVTSHAAIVSRELGI
ncbi:MAG: PEP-utilizing enzyme, partial [Patescibacteria group bacterium]